MNAKEIPILPLLQNCSFSDEIHQPQPWPLQPLDLQGLIENTQDVTFQCDSDVHRLHVTSGKGGFINGNLCYVDGLLFMEGKDAAVAHIHIDYDNEHRLFINLKSLVSRFRWSCRSNEPETRSSISLSTPERAKSGRCFVATAAYGSPFAPE
ncbi:MAG TPA: hypothetical protein VGW76_18460, partial [Pyrinomonadaceae bacterium]|nr:hypothetical protein [Pyrinomonadaceae bacterium]